VTQLAAKFFRGKGLFGTGQQEHGGYPVTERKFGALHDGTGAQGLPAMAVSALKAQFIGIPAMFQTATMLADNTGLFPLFLQIGYARGLIGETLHEIKYIHKVSICCFYTINILRNCFEFIHFTLLSIICIIVRYIIVFEVSVSTS
jgi:hypothetical protein